MQQRGKLVQASSGTAGSETSDDSSTSTAKSKAATALQSLDSLLSSTDDEDDKRKSAEETVVPLFKRKVTQSAPPRQDLYSKDNNVGRFLISESLLRSELRVGRRTELGRSVELPRVTPIISYMLLATEVVVFGTYSNILSMQGPVAAQEFVDGLVNSHSLVDSQGELYRLASCLLMHDSMAALALTVWGLVTVAPEVEAVMGYQTFGCIFLLSGLWGSVAQLATDSLLLSLAQSVLTTTTPSASSPSAAAATAAAAALSSHPGASCGAAAALMGVAAALLVHRLRNRGAEDASPSSANSMQQDGRAGSNSSWGVLRDVNFAVQAGVLAAGALVLALPHDGGAGMGLPALVAGAGAGAALAYGQCPIYQVNREVDIPEGSMMIPEEGAKEVVVVVDVRSDLSRLLTGLGVGAALVAAYNVLA